MTTWREDRERRWRAILRELRREAREQAEAGERPWHARGMPPEVARRLAELRLQLRAPEAAAVLLEELRGRSAEVVPRKWAVSGFGPGWGRWGR